MTSYNVLNGDSMRGEFESANIPGEVIIFREGLIDGVLSGVTLPEFWSSRSKYMEISKEEYHKTFVSEISKILNAANDSEFNLWFEYDLFCQVNMWFLLSIIADLQIRKKAYVVYSSYLSKGSKYFWNGFGPARKDDMTLCFKQRLPLSEADILFGKVLWMAYKEGDLNKLKTMVPRASSSFPYLREVVAAHLDRYSSDDQPSRVESVVAQIIRNGPATFEDAFVEFWKTESIYGFGDTQFKSIYDKVKTKM